MKILVIEKETVFLDYLDILLSKGHHDLLKAASGADGIRILQTTPADLVLVDVFINNRKGDDLISQIKHVAPASKIIAMTGSSSRETETRIRTQGVLYYLIKPFEMMHLGAIINHVDAKTRQTP